MNVQSIITFIFIDISLNHSDFNMFIAYLQLDCTKSLLNMCTLTATQPIVMYENSEI